MDEKQEREIAWMIEDARKNLRESKRYQASNPSYAVTCIGTALGRLQYAQNLIEEIEAWRCSDE